MSRHGKLETFTDLKDFVDNPYFHDQRKIGFIELLGKSWKL
jgi:hypothetical protein